MVLVGPSGSGTDDGSQMVAGLEDITSGHCGWAARPSTTCPRRTATWPWSSRTTPCTRTMNRGQNIGFALKLRKFPKQEINTKVREAAPALGA